MTARSRIKLELQPIAWVKPGVEPRTSAAWDDTYNQAPYIVWGWTAAVAKKSKNHEMAFDYLCFFANDANHQADIAIGRFRCEPVQEI